VLARGHADWLELRPPAHWPGALLVPSRSWPWTEPTGWPTTRPQVRLLWRFHALHHSQELSVLTSFRAHPLMHTTGFILATIPVGADAAALCPVLITIYICVGTLQHAKPPLDLRPAPAGSW